MAGVFFIVVKLLGLILTAVSHMGKGQNKACFTQ